MLTAAANGDKLQNQGLQVSGMLNEKHFSENSKSSSRHNDTAS
jgi:hypothetical protein